MEKFDGAGDPNRASWGHLAQYMEQYLRGQQELSESRLCQKEMVILRAMDWQLDLPFTEQWINIYCSRLNILSVAYKETVAWVEQKALFYSRLLVIRESASVDSLPRVLSLGLLCLGLVWGRLLPWEELCPDEGSNWHSTFLQICSAVGANVTHGKRGPATFNAVQMLKAAALTDLVSMRSATEVVMKKLVSMLDDRSNPLFKAYA